MYKDSQMSEENVVEKNIKILEAQKIAFRSRNMTYPTLNKKLILPK